MPVYIYTHKYTILHTLRIHNNTELQSKRPCIKRTQTHAHYHDFFTRNQRSVTPRDRLFYINIIAILFEGLSCRVLWCDDDDELDIACNKHGGKLRWSIATLSAGNCPLANWRTWTTEFPYISAHSRGSSSPNANRPSPSRTSILLTHIIYMIYIVYVYI